MSNNCNTCGGYVSAGGECRKCATPTNPPAKHPPMVRLAVWVNYDSKTGYVWPQVYPTEKDAYIDEALNFPLKTMRLVSEPYPLTERRTCTGSFGTEIPANPPAKHPPPRLYRWKYSGAFQEHANPNGEHTEYLSLEEHTALLQEERARGREEAFDAVLAAAQRIYEEEHDSDPSDYFYTKKAVEAARSPGDAEKGE